MASYHFIDGLIILILFLALCGVYCIWGCCIDLIDDWKIEKERKRRGKDERITDCRIDKQK